MQLPPANINRINLSTIIIISIIMLVLTGCSRSVTPGVPFLIRDGQTIHLKGTGLTIQAEEIIQGLDGSQNLEDGSVILWVTDQAGSQKEFYLETGGWVSTGQYEIQFQRVVSDADGLGCELIVNQK